MLMYVIPLIILIVVLLVVKKRQDAQESGQPKNKGNTKTKAKKSSSTRVQAKPTKIVEDEVVEPKQTQPLATETRKKIETLIQDRNFFAAEAQINQALKRDNSQHELYLLLLDVHLEQKDEFAVNQLLSHINALELHEIAQKAEEKVATEKSKAKSNDFIQFTPSHEETAQQPVKPVTHDSFSDDAFDALINNPSEPVQTITEEKPKFENTELEFTTSSSSEAQETVEPLVENNTLEFSTEFTTNEIQPQVEEKSAIDEIKPLDFSFTISSNETIEEKSSEPVQANVNDEPQKSNEFNLDFVIDQTPAVEPEQPNTKLDEQPEFSFNLDSAPVVEDVKTTEVELAKSFDASVLENTTPAPVATETPIVAVSDINLADPLVQSFPSLSEVNEAELNLDLAKKYIELGAYDAAREILADSNVNFSDEQRQVADQLLNQIASS
ncbi:hypothetical protein SKM57_04555 [Acinetobacter faecalis]|uniref:hypothetical protein n=1 Tax=Acinetobacter faecalis TaxID=2665161 RepID=UPI002A920522|nr:hypothetical protein [Acinetobacter faecalis]MDY6467860.1 hypothetical protein [Acinetobacter faecalis]